jgi:putative methyltransferase (TIGR04325 family)
VRNWGNRTRIADVVHLLAGPRRTRFSAAGSPIDHPRGKIMIDRIVNYVRQRKCPPNGFLGVFESFEQADASAPRGHKTGYESGDTGSWYRDKLEHVEFDQYPMLYWFDKASKSARTVVEIGGHVGVAYYPFSKFVEHAQSLTWTIVDVPSVTREGEKLARERNRTNLVFLNSLEDVQGPVDILMASGALQYVSGALLPERVRAMAAKPAHIIIHNTPVRPQKGYVTLQNLGPSWCPYRIHGHNELIDPFNAMGYDLVDSWGKDRRVEIPSRPDLRVDHYSGYYLRLSETGSPM